jgi:putative ABC transport system substrate-binding protein
MRRRDFIMSLGGSALWHAPQAVPVIGFVNGAIAATYVPFVGAFRDGLSNAGFIEDQNVTIEYRGSIRESPEC